jgi:hypothetical protein
MVHRRLASQLRLEPTNTLFDSIRFLRGLRFPPTLQHKLLNIVYRASNALLFRGWGMDILRLRPFSLESPLPHKQWGGLCTPVFQGHWTICDWPLCPGTSSLSWMKHLSSPTGDRRPLTCPCAWYILLLHSPFLWYYSLRINMRVGTSWCWKFSHWKLSQGFLWTENGITLKWKNSLRTDGVLKEF